jgi:hypothetical protein
MSEDRTIEERVRALELSLHGDVGQRELYETSKKNHVTPNIEEPPPGLIETITDLAITTNEMAIDARAGAAMADKFERLDQRVSELVVNQPATKKDIDDAQTRFANAIYERMGRLERTCAEQLTEWHDAWADKVRDGYKWAMKFKAKQTQPSRLHSLLHAITGRAVNGGNSHVED